MTSLYVTVLYILLDLDLARNATREHMEKHLPHTSFEMHTVQEPLNLCREMCFKFGDDVHLQI